MFRRPVVDREVAPVGWSMQHYPVVEQSRSLQIQ
jgi:hypothetical protein